MVIKRVTPQQEQMEIQDGDFSLKSPAWLTVKKKKKTQEMSGQGYGFIPVGLRHGVLATKAGIASAVPQQKPVRWSLFSS